MFKFVLEPAEDGCLRVRSEYVAGDRVAEFVEMQLRALVESMDAPTKRKNRRA